MKKLTLLLVPLLLSACATKKEKSAFEHFCYFYNDDYASVYIETATEHEVHEIRYFSKTFFAESTIKRDEYNFLYAKIDVIYLANDNFYKLNWLVEYKYNDDYSYEQATNYTVFQTK